MTVSRPDDEGVGPDDAAQPDGAAASAPRRTEPAHVDFPPVENGVDYLRSVVDHLTAFDPPAPRDLKYAVLHLQAAAEVLLKSRLMHEHWSLVFKEPGSATRKKFESGDFESCTTQAAVDRLRNVADVAVHDKGAAALKALAKSRNALQHYGLTTSAPAVEARAAEVLDFLMDFVHAELALAQPEAEYQDLDPVTEDLRYVQAKLGTIKSFIKRRHDQLRPELQQVLDVTVQCSLCAQWALVLGAGASPITCRFCHITWETPELAAVDCGIAATGHGFGVDVVDCPNCGETAVLVDLAAVASAPGHRHSVCFACGTGFNELKECESCEQRYSPGSDDDFGLCLGCLNARIDRF